jgi:hypothetical protein
LGQEVGTHADGVSEVETTVYGKEEKKRIGKR